VVVFFKSSHSVSKKGVAEINYLLRSRVRAYKFTIQTVDHDLEALKPLQTSSLGCEHPRPDRST